MTNNFCIWCHQVDYERLEGTNHTATRRTAICPRCGRAVTLVEIQTAAQIVDVSRKTIYDWIRKDLVSSMRMSGGRQLVCLSSLFDPRRKV